VLDAYFAVGPVFKILKKVVDADGRRLVHIVTRAKSNAVAYDDPPAQTGGRGRPRKYGPKLKLMFSKFGRQRSSKPASNYMVAARPSLFFVLI
jgi:hypothetical protein